MKKTAVILFNLGGPDSPAAVKPFLFNLFHDRAIIDLKQPWRFLIAKLISARRAPIAREIYAKIGGSSPILKNTQMQAQALEKKLNADASGAVYKTFIVMRYWHPFASETAQQVKDFAPDEILLLPLYPQFSTTTTQSSFEEWECVARQTGLNQPTRKICCYPQQPGFIRALAEAALPAYDAAKSHGKPRILFSAHGLPEKIIKNGDPYQAQCRLTAAVLLLELGIENLDAVLCFQSRVGPMRWIGPATDDEIRRAGKDKVPVVVVPIAFVSDHSETLVELDIEYRHLATQSGVPFYATVPPVGTAQDFIDGLAQMVTDAQAREKDCVSATGGRLCPQEFPRCICKAA